jgi:hypothetical protein
VPARKDKNFRLFHIYEKWFFFSYEGCFITTGLVLPAPHADPANRQLQLLDTVKSFIARLDPALSIHELKYVRVLKGPAPSILEVECTTVEGYI